MQSEIQLAQPNPKIEILGSLRSRLQHFGSISDTGELKSLGEEISREIRDPDSIPPFVFTPTGKMVILDPQKKEKIADEFSNLQDHPDKVTRAQEVVENMISGLARVNQEDQRIITDLRKQTSASARELTEEQIQDLDLRAEKLISSEPTSEFNLALLNALITNPRYAVAGELFVELQKQSNEILRNLTNNDNSSSTLQQAKNLLKINRRLESGKKIDATALVPKDISERITILRATMERDPKTRAKRWQEFSILLKSAVDSLVEPNSPINLILAAENKGLFDEKKPTEASREVKTECLKSLRDTLPQIAQSYRIAHITEEIAKSETFIGDKKSFEQQKKYLSYRSLVAAIEKNICNPQLAWEAAQGSDILESSKIIDLVPALMEPEPTRPKAEIDRDVNSHVLVSLKKLNRIILTATTIGNILSLPSEARMALAQNTIAAVQQIGENASIALKPQLPKIEPEKIQKAIKDMQDQKEQKPKPLEKNPADALKQKSTEKRYKAPDLTDKNMKWRAGQEDSSKASLSSEYGVSPEQYIQQSLQIAWQILGKSSGVPDYLVTKVAPIYNPKSNAFESEDVQISQLKFRSSNTEVDKSNLQIFAKRQQLFGNLISIPSPSGYQANTVRMEIIDKLTRQVVVHIDASISEDEFGNQYVSVDNPIDQLPPGQEIQLTVGLDPAANPDFKPDFLYFDNDAKFPTRDIFPDELNSLIDNLNSRENLSDTEKLGLLKEWFLNNFTYSFDQAYSQYYLKNNPNPEIFYKRFFGTGNSEADPLYNPDPGVAMKGVCGSVNTAFALAARELDLNDGQIFMAIGYINNGFYSSNVNTITDGELHAWAMYMKNDGKSVNFDATPSKIDRYTQDVLSSTRRNRGPSEAQSRDKSFQSDEPYFAISEFKPDTYRPMFSLKDNMPIISRIENSLPQTEQPIDSWQIIEPEQSIYASQRSFNFFVPLRKSLTFNSSGWISNEYEKYIPLSFNQGFQDLTQFDSASRNLNMKPKQPEDIAITFRGIVKLQDNKVYLPNLGQISPRSITANILITDATGRIRKEPLALDELRAYEGDALGYSYILGFDQDATSLKDQVIEITYKSAPAFNLAKITMNKEQAKDFFAATVPRESFGPEFANFLNTLDKAATLGQVEDAKLSDFKIDDEYWNDSSQRKGLSSYRELELHDYMKLSLLSQYINQNIQITWNPEWTKLYTDKSLKRTEFVQRVMQYKKADPETAKTVYILAAKTLRSEDGDFNMPINAEIGYSQYTPNLFFSQNDNFDSPFWSNYPNDPNLLTKGKLTLVPIYYQIFPSESDSDNITFYTSLNSRMTGPELDPLSKDLAAQTLFKMYSSPADIPDGFQNYILQNSLPEKERKFQSLSELVELKFLQWYHNDPNRNTQAAIGMLSGLIIADRIRRRTQWWKDLSPKQFHDSLSAAAAELGLSKEHPMFKDMQDFYDQVLSKKYSHVPIVHSFQKAMSMDKYIRSRKPAKSKFRNSPAEVFRPLGISSLFDTFNVEGAKTGINIAFKGHAEKYKFEEIAINNHGQWDTQSQQLARRFLTNVIHHPYIEKVLQRRFENATNALEGALENLFPTNGPFVFNSGAFLTHISQDIARLSVSDPDKFVTEVKKAYDLWLMRGIALDRLDPNMRKQIQSNEELNKLAYDLKQSLPSDVSRQLDNIYQTLASEIMLPRYALIESEKLKIAQWQKQRHDEKKKWKLSRKKKQL